MMTPRSSHTIFHSAALQTAAAALFAAALVMPASARKSPLPGGAGSITTVTITNGNGEGKATLTVDGYGAFGTEAGSRSLRYRPVGAPAAADTAFFSGLWFSGANKAGQGGGGYYLDAAEIDDIAVTRAANDRATSSFTREGLQFDLDQQLIATSTGTTLVQRYKITNTTANAISFDLIRHFDGDLQFDASINDAGGVSSNGQVAFQFDRRSGGGNASPAPAGGGSGLPTFVGIDFQGDANLGFRIAAFEDPSGVPFKEQIRRNGRAVINNTLTNEDGQNADTNGDLVTDTNFDVCVNLGATHTVAPGAPIEVVARTFLGEGDPDQIVRAPSNLRGSSPSSDKVDLNWDDNSSNEQGFAVERRAEPGGSFEEIGRTAANVVSFNDTGLTGNTRYTYRVRAFFSDGQFSPFSNEFTITTPPSPVTVNAPSNLQAVPAGTDSVNLSWQDNSDNETRFEIEKKSEGGSFQQVGTVGAGVVTFSMSGLAAETTYIFRVRAVREDGSTVTPSPYSNESTVTTLPPAPGNLTAAAAGATSIELTWNDRSTTETSFRIERKTGAGEFAEAGSAAANATSFTDTGLEPNTEYIYRVIAVAPQGASAPSDTASARTQQTNFPPRFVDPTPRHNRTFDVTLGETVEFTVKAEDENAGDSVTLSVSGLPPGATVTPESPATGNPASLRFRWTPGEADINGSPHSVTFTIAGAGQGLSRTFKINVVRRDEGICASGSIRANGVKLRLKSSVGWPRNSRRLKGYVQVAFPSARQNLKATRLDSLQFEGTRATVTGLATVGRERNVPFRLVVLDGGPGPNDRLVELQVGSEQWPSGAMQQADVHVHRQGRK